MADTSIGEVEATLATLHLRPLSYVRIYTFREYAAFKVISLT